MTLIMKRNKVLTNIENEEYVLSVPLIHIVLLKQMQSIYRHSSTAILPIKMSMYRSLFDIYNLVK